MSLLRSFKKIKNLVTFFCLTIAYCLIKSVDLEKLDENLTVDKNGNKACENKSQTLSILVVGVLSSVVFSFIGILPAFFIRTDADEEKFKNSVLFKLLLAFAAGSLLGDIFFHLLPEASGDEVTMLKNGKYIVMAFMLFLCIEKITGIIPDAHAVGTLNLIANLFDNGSHATTVVGAFQVSVTFGLIALLATIIHEVPHEMSDFALLLRDGYSRNKAISAQLITAFTGAFVATLAFAMTSNNGSCGDDPALNKYLETNQINIDTHHHNHGHHHSDNHGHSKSSIILPFTIGGFLYIALVGIIPEIVEEQDRKMSVLQLISIIFGIVFIYALVQIESILPTYFGMNL